MSFSLVDHSGASSLDDRNVTSGLMNTATADLMVAVIHDFGASALGTIADSKTNSWNVLTSYQTTTRARCTIAWSRPTSVGSSHTVTYSGPIGCFPSITVSAWSASSSSPFNIETGASSGASATLATGSVTPGFANSLVIAGITTSAGTVSSINGGFTITDTQAAGSEEGGSHAWLVQTAIAAANPTWTNSTSTDMAAAIAVFKVVVFTLPDSVPHDFTNPRRRITSPQRFSVEQRLNLPMFFYVPPNPFTPGNYGLYPNPVRRKSSEAWRWGIEHSTPIGPYAPYFPLPTDVIFTIGGTSVVAFVNNANTEINDFINEQSNTCSFKINGFQPVVGQDVQIGLGSIDPTRLIFAGTITNVKQIYDSSPAFGKTNVAWLCDCIDYTFLLNRRRPMGIFTNVSASTVFSSLISSFSSGFSTSGVPSGLPNITISFDGTHTFAQCLTDICNLLLMKWKMSYGKVLQVFESTLPGSQPAVIDVNNLTTQRDPLFSYEIDLTQIRTQVIGKGPLQNLLTDILASETIVPIPNVTVFSLVGGTAFIGPVPFTYTGLQQPSTPGAFVGPGTNPSTALTVAAVSFLNNLEAMSRYAYEYTFVTALGESLPSPLTSIVTGILSPPTAPSLNGGNSAGSIDDGFHQYGVTFVTGAGETTLGNIGASFTAFTLPDPGAVAPVSAVTNPKFYTLDGQAPGVTIDIAFFYTNLGGAKTLVSTSYISYTTEGSSYGTLVVDITVPGVADPNVQVIEIATRWPALGGTWVDNFCGVQNPGLGNTATAYNCIPGYRFGENAPIVNVPQNRSVFIELPIGSPEVTGRNLYRQQNGTGLFKLAALIPDNTTTLYTDSVSNAGLTVGAPISNTATTRSVNVSGIAAGPATVTGRNLYRTTGGGLQPKLLVSIANNVDTTYSDNVPDGSLGANPPVGDTSGLSNPTVNGAGFYSSASVIFPTNGAATLATSTAPVFTSASYAFVAGDVGAYLFIKSGTNWIAGRYLIASVSAGAAILSAACATVASPTTATWGVDYSIQTNSRYSFADIVIDATTNTKFTSAANPVGVNFIGNVIAIQGSVGFISQRVIVLSTAGTVATADKPLGTTSSTGGQGNLGGSAVSTFVTPGSTSIQVASVGPFFATGGWALNGSNYIRYAGISSNAIIGIPASGLGSISTPIALGSAITSISSLIGCIGVPASIAGTNVYLSVQIDDLAAQAVLAALEGGDGVHQYIFSDTSAVDLASLTAEAQSVLDAFGEVLVTIVEGARDINTNAGKELVINLPFPILISVTLLIQSVRISNIGTEPGAYPLFTATASSVKYTLQDLIRQLGTLVPQS